MKLQFQAALVLIIGLLSVGRLAAEEKIFLPKDAKGLPDGWRFVGGDWKLKPLVRPARAPAAVAAVTSTNHVAFPGICKTKQGTLLVVYREAYSHASGNPDDGRVMLVRSTDGGQTWGRPELVVDDPTIDDRNAAISCMNDGTVCVIWDRYLKGKQRRSHHWAWMTQSSDEGRTWSEPIKVSKTENVHTRSRAIDLGTGKWLVPYSESTSSPTASSFFAIFDPITKAFEEIAATPRGVRAVADETAVVRAANGDLVALIRSNWDPELFQIVSKDDGRTWSEPRPSGIPSQFTPADIIKLDDGRLAASFSFRERRNERIVVSRDNGRTWNIENSVELYDGTFKVGGDRSYPASMQLDAQTIGTVLYETRPKPAGGHIWFVATKISAFDAAKENTLYQGDIQTDSAIALWPEGRYDNGAEFSYRFTGRFGLTPSTVGLIMQYADAKNYTALEFQMGAARDNRSGTNQVRLVRSVDGKRTIDQAKPAAKDWFNDGNIHRFSVRPRGDQWVMAIDGIEQLSVPRSTGKPLGIAVGRAAVAVYSVK